MELNLKFSAQPEIENGLPTKFSGICYHGDVIKNYMDFGDIIIDLNTIKFSSETLVLMHHNPRKRIGVANLSLKNGKVIFNGRFSDNELALDVRKECSIKMPWELSLGLIGEATKLNGDTVVNGRFVKANHLISKARVKELSFVSFGAADNTQLFTFAKSEKIDFARLLFDQVAGKLQSGDVRHDYLNLASTLAVTAENRSYAELGRLLMEQVSYYE